MNWIIEDAVPGDAEGAGLAMADAFSDDPQAAYLFPVEPVYRSRLLSGFFTILAGARIAMGMPVKVLKVQDNVGGIVMGYNTLRPAWPNEWQQRLARLEADCEGLFSRFDAMDSICNKFKPQVPHNYLGVLGLHRSLHGIGAGSALIREFCAMSDADPASTGTYLDTCSPKNVPFYRRMGFDILGEGSLDPRTTIWCLFRPKPGLRHPSR